MDVIRCAANLVAFVGVAVAVAASPDAGCGQEPSAASNSRRQGRQLAGSVSCRECHRRFFELWAPSHHGLAMQPYSSDFARGQLTAHRSEIKIGERGYQAHIAAQDGWVLERGPEGEKRLPMAHVLGGKNVFYFLTAVEGGRLQTLPVAYDVRRREWFDTAASGVRHSSGQSDEPLLWTDREYTFNTSCYNCHVSQLSTNYDPTTDTYRTSWAEPGINCETCHGDGGEHVAVCRESPEGATPEDLKIISMKSLTVEQTNAACAGCHAKMVPLTTTFRPGERYFDHFDLVTLEDPDFYPDGRDLGENYTYTTWQMSRCVLAGQLDCVHCHTSSGRFRFQDQPDRSCLPCHEQRVHNVSAHSRHPSDSAGSRCISCHMPMTEFARMRRSDHSMRPPMPAATVRLGSPNACNICHADKDAAWADTHVRTWHPRDYQAPELYRAGLVEAARKNDWSRLSDVLAYLSGGERDEIFATALIRLLRSCPDERKVPAMIGALKSPSPLVRAAAADVLNGWLTRESVAALVEATRDEYRLVRVRAAEALAGVPQESLSLEERGTVAKATAELEAAMGVRPDDAASHYNLGNLHLARGELKQAIACFEQSRRLDPRRIEPLVNASIAYNLEGQNDKAEASLRQALQLDPASAAANINLGMLLGEMARTGEAEAAFRAARRADPQSAEAAYNLAVIVARDRVEEAITLCREAAELRPGEPKFAYTLAFYLRQGGRIEEAVQTLRRMLGEHPGSVDGHMLLGDILERQGRFEEAIDVYREAANSEQLPAQARGRFAARIRALRTKTD